MEFESLVSRYSSFLTAVFALVCAYALLKVATTGLRAYLRFRGRRSAHADIHNEKLRELLNRADLSPWPPLIECLFYFVAAALTFGGALTLIKLS